MSSIRRPLCVSISLSALLLVSLACAGSVPTPTPTVIPLSRYPTPTVVPTLVTPAQPTPTPRPAAVATPAAAPPQEATESAATAEPTPQRIMALGRRQSVPLYALPDAAGRLLATLAGSTVFWADARSADGAWLRVSHGETSQQGWAAASDLAILGDVEQLPAATAEALAVATTAPALASQQSSGRVLADRLNVRLRPALPGAVLGQLGSGEVLTLVGRNTAADWLAIAWQDDVGWVAAEYVAVDGEVLLLPVVAEDISQLTPLAPALPGKIVFQTSIGGDIWLVGADGSGLRRLTDGLDPALSPDGTLLAFARWGGPHGIFLLDLTSGAERRLATANHPRSPSWSADGSSVAFSHATGSYTCLSTPFGCIGEAQLRMMFGGKDCLDTPAGRMCISDFPAVSRENTGLAQVAVADGAWLDLPSDQAAQSPQRNPMTGELLYRGKDGLQISTTAKTRTLVAQPDMGSPAWSPDGLQIAVQQHLHDHTDLFLLDAAGHVVRRLTQPPAVGRAPNNVAPAWSPDGQSIVFLSDRDGSWRLYRMASDGSAQSLLLPQVLGDIAFRYEFAAERVVSWGP